MKGKYVAERIAGTDPDSRIRQLEEQLKRRDAELTEYIRAEQVMIAAGIVSKAKVEQAHDIVRGLTD